MVPYSDGTVVRKKKKEIKKEGRKEEGRKEGRKKERKKKERRKKKEKERRKKQEIGWRSGEGRKQRREGCFLRLPYVDTPSS